MSTEVEQSVVENLEGKINHLAMEVSLLREQIRTQINSRRGLEGARGPVGEIGPAGKDAVIKIVQVDGKVQVIEGDKVAAEIVAVPGPAGKDGRHGLDGKSITGPKGDTPAVDAIVAEVVKVLEARLLRK
jgi:hypothetical protein